MSFSKTASFFHQEPKKPSPATKTKTSSSSPSTEQPIHLALPINNDLNNNNNNNNNNNLNNNNNSNNNNNNNNNNTKNNINSHSSSASSSSSSSFQSSSSSESSSSTSTNSSSSLQSTTTHSPPNSHSTTATTLPPSSNPIRLKPIPTEQHPSPNPTNSLIGSTILSSSSGTRYRLNRFLGQGTFSHVIQASPSSSNTLKHQSVALKLIKSTSASNHSLPPNLIYQDEIPTDEYEFIRISALREIEILKSIDHPSIIKLIETFTIPERDEYYDSKTTKSILSHSILNVIVLEEVRGGELFQLVSKSQSSLKPGIVCRLMSELCIAVDWLHSHHIVHRDLKLENILLVRDIQNDEATVEEMKVNRGVYLKLTDFGLSVKTISSETTTGAKDGLLRSRCGSEEYAAPEIILGRMYDGRKTDGWAVGVIGYSLVTGMLPFQLPEPFAGPASHDEQGQIEDADYRAYLSKRKAGLLKIIKSEFSWSIAQSPAQSPTSLRRSDVDGQIELVNKLLIRDPLRRPADLRFGFRDPAWLGQFAWLKDLLSPPL